MHVKSCSKCISAHLLTTNMTIQTFCQKAFSARLLTSCDPSPVTNGVTQISMHRNVLSSCIAVLSFTLTLKVISYPFIELDLWVKSLKLVCLKEILPWSIKWSSVRFMGNGKNVNIKFTTNGHSIAHYIYFVKAKTGSTHYTLKANCKHQKYMLLVTKTIYLSL